MIPGAGPCRRLGFDDDRLAQRPQRQRRQRHHHHGQRDLAPAHVAARTGERVGIVDRAMAQVAPRLPVGHRGRLHVALRAHMPRPGPQHVPADDGHQLRGPDETGREPAGARHEERRAEHVPSLLEGVADGDDDVLPPDQQVGQVVGDEVADGDRQQPRPDRPRAHGACHVERPRDDDPQEPEQQQRPGQERRRTEGRREQRRSARGRRTRSRRWRWRPARSAPSPRSPRARLTRTAAG